MKKWARANYMPNKPLYEGKQYVTAGEEHLMFSKKAAQEGMVLLKNEGSLLPLQPNQRIAIFGKALFDYVKGGGGSGDVSVEYVHNLYDGFHSLEETIQIYEPLADYYRENVSEQYKKGALPGLTVEPEIPEEYLTQAANYTDTAMIVISRFSGEGWDRRSVYYEGQEPWEEDQSRVSQAVFGDTDYYLTESESSMIKNVKEYFHKIILVLNIGSVMDSSWFAEDKDLSSVLLIWQAGMEGGRAAAEILMGLENPSGKLPDTFAKSLDDYPSTKGFHDSPDYVNYLEDIYVGYRYFETIPGKKERVNYPFGYGLSYTNFRINPLAMAQEENSLYFMVKVTNTGKRAGKEVVQIYMEAPQGVLGKAGRSLVAFEKTKKLQPGEDQLIALEVPFYTMASYDDLGKIQKSAYLLEEGEYRFYIDNCVRMPGQDSKPAYGFHLSENRILEQLSEKCSPCRLAERMMSDGSLEKLTVDLSCNIRKNVLGDTEEWKDGLKPIIRGVDLNCTEENPDHINLMDVYEGKRNLEEFLAQFTDLELADLLGGQPNQGIANTFGFGNNPRYGVPSLMTTDGPAGVRILPEYAIYTTAWPCTTLLASSWNRELLYQLGIMVAEEVKENNLCVWLAPAVNIHRNPLCGRNFEYYSEDPLLTGELAASLVGGIQSLKVGATVKHFACNNKETNRRNSDSRLSERALREIYLKQFEIIVRRSQPWVIMSSYNLINGVRASENKELLEYILRDEWGYEGVVCTDWYTRGEHYKEVLAGNDIKMGTGFPERLMQALELGAICREDLLHCARRVLEMIMKVD